MLSRRRAIILDASAFIAGYDPFSVMDEQYSIPNVRKELSDKSLSRIRFDEAHACKRLRLVEPDQRFVEEARRFSTEVGDISFLSDVDLKILALAIQLKREGLSPSIITDDYSIQNVARKIGVNFKPLATSGIKFQLKWILYCPACHKRYPSNYDSNICEICGTKLKRKSITKTPIEKGKRQTSL